MPMRYVLRISLFGVLLCLWGRGGVVRYTTDLKDNDTVLTSVTLREGGEMRVYNPAKLIAGTICHYRSGGGVAIVRGGGTTSSTPEERLALLDGRLTCGLGNPGAARTPLKADPVTTGNATTPGVGIRFAEPVVNRPGADVVIFELHKGGRQGDAFHVSPLHFAPGLHGITVERYDISPTKEAAREIGAVNLFGFMKSPRRLDEFGAFPLRRHSVNEGGFRAIAVGIDLSQLGYAAGQKVEGLFLQAVSGRAAFDPAAVLGLPEATPGNLLAKEPQPKEFQPEQTPMLAEALASEAGAFEEIVFAQRVSGRDHWYGNFGHYCETESPYSRAALTTEGDMRYAFAPGGRLCRYNLRTGELRVLLDDPDGGIRDPNLDYDAKKILFSYRKGKSKSFHLYEIGIEGDGLRQLTDGPDNDIEPIYMPDGSIMFCSSRCHRYVPCWRTQVAVLYRCDADGGNIRMISNNAEQENTPWMLPDGRVLYMRWEYVDRNQLRYHHLWTVNPDGTGVMVYFGNQFRSYAMLDAKPIPGSRSIVASFSPGHGRAEHMGYVTIVDPRNGPDDMGMAKRIGRQSFRDPYPLSQQHFLVADGRGIHLLARDGTSQLLYRPHRPGRRWACHEPRPLRIRPREPVIADRIQPRSPTGQLVLSDIYRGRNMKGVKRGEIKELLVLEQLPKPANFSGGQEPLTIGGTFTLQRLLGTVPVEADGSANFEVPALKSVFFMALDAKGDSVKRMQSFVTVQPGEMVSCVGCHEPRTQAPHARQRPALLAVGREPSKITPIKGMPDVLDFPRDVQPILDRHCIRCHNTRKRSKGIDLSGDRTPFYSISYWTMFTHGLVKDGRNGSGNRAPRTLGTSASLLAKVIEGHGGRVKMSEREKQAIRLWIESGVVYPGTYGGLGSGMVAVKYPHEVMKRRCASCHTAKEKSYRNVKKGAFYYQFGVRKPPQPLWDNPNDITMIRHLAYFQLGESRLYQAFCNMDRPEESLLLLAPLAKSAGGLQLCGETPIFQSTDDADYQQILAAIQAAAKELQTVKRFDMPGFRPNRFYIREMQNYGILPGNLPSDAPVDPYVTDQTYWRSFRYLPK